MRITSSSPRSAGQFATATTFFVLAVMAATAADPLNPASTADSKRPFRRHDYKLTFKRPYYYNNSIPFWEIFGSTIPSQEYIRLTSSVPGLKGSIWAKEANQHPEWEAEFSFIASGRGIAGGDGLAFWYTSDRGQDGPVFGSKDKWIGLGIFFDTYDELSSRNNPIVYGVVNDGSREVANIKNPDQVKFASCWRDYRNPVGPVSVRVSYYGKRLSVDIDTVQRGKSYVSCFESQDIGLPVGYYFGLSAMAGNFPDDHDIISFETYEVNPKVASEHPLRPHEKEKIAQGKEFNVTDDTKKHIKEVEHKIEQTRQKEEEARHIGHVDSVALSHQLQETQFRIIESLNALHEKLERLGAPASPKSLPASVESRLGTMSSSLVAVNAQLKSLADTVTALTIQSRDSGSGIGGSQSEHVISQLHDSVQDLRTKCEILQNRIADAEDLSDEHGSYILLYAVAFFGFQAVVLWFFGRRKPDAPKKFI